jgi:hypothetical protein
VQPFADEPRDFPAEWTSLPWEEASKLCVPGKAPNLESWHRRFNETFGAILTDRDRVTFEKEAPRANAGRTSITFACSTDAQGRHVCKRLPAQITFGLVKDGKGWLIESISDGSATKRASP